MLHLTLRAEPTLPLELDQATPDVWQTLTPQAILQQPVRIGRTLEPLGTFFQATGDPSDGRIHITGNLTRVHGLGRGMGTGELIVHGAVGHHAGAQMTGGLFRVESAGDWLGAEMQGGQIEVLGSSGDHTGGAYPGSRLGMRGGRIHIHANTGRDTAAQMRRGLVQIDGQAGPFLAAGMIAGTVIAQAVSSSPGIGMKRGTLWVRTPFPMPPGFTWACRIEPAFLGWMEQMLPLKGIAGVVNCYRGDLLSGGRGEVLIPCPPTDSDAW